MYDELMKVLSEAVKKGSSPKIVTLETDSQESYAGIKQLLDASLKVRSIKAGNIQYEFPPGPERIGKNSCFISLTLVNN